LTKKTQRQPSMPTMESAPCEEAADQGTYHTAGAEHRHEHALVFGALTGRDDVAEDRQRQ
jgi:hypothetical protein